jgi:anti-sigma factor RsiW
MAPGHPPFDRLVGLVKGDLATDQRAEVAAHVAACSECAAQISWLGHLLDLFHTDDSESAPSSAIAHIRSLFPAMVTPQAADGWRRMIAVLVFDSARMPLAPSMRSRALVKRQLMFTAAELGLDIHVASTGSAWTISGQVLGSDEGGHVALQGQAATFQATLNDLSQFTLPPVASGTYTLIVQLKDTVIEIPTLEIGS